MDALSLDQWAKGPKAITLFKTLKYNFIVKTFIRACFVERGHTINL